MPAEVLVRLLREGLYLAILISAPAVAAAMVAGLVTSVLMAATQVQEQSVSHGARLVAVLAALVAAGPWIGAQLIRFTTTVLDAVAVV